MRRKIMAFVLCLAMLMSMFVPGTLATSAASDSNVDQKVTVYYNGNPQSNVTLPKGSSIELSSAGGSAGGYSFDRPRREAIGKAHEKQEKCKIKNKMSSWFDRVSCSSFC